MAEALNVVEMDFVKHSDPSKAYSELKAKMWEVSKMRSAEEENEPISNR